MKYYATLLNIKEVNEHSLDVKDIVDPQLQWSLLGRMVCGIGATEGESLQDALDNLIDDCVLEICECNEGVKSIVTKLPAKEALRHLWMHYDELNGDYRLYPMPFHDNFVDFCERHSLGKDAQKELESFFDSLLHTSLQARQ